MPLLTNSCGQPKNEALFFGGEGWAYLRLVIVGSVRPHVVRRALHDDGICLACVFRDVNCGEQAHAIAHGNPIFVFGVMRQRVGKLGSRNIRERRGSGLGEYGAGDDQANQRKFSNCHWEVIVSNPGRNS
jgi:hypothetical protein